jgi:hypothetical protein
MEKRGPWLREEKCPKLGVAAAKCLEREHSRRLSDTRMRQIERKTQDYAGFYLAAGEDAGTQNLSDEL